MLIRYWNTWLVLLTACLVAIVVGFSVAYILFSMFKLEPLGEAVLVGLAMLIITFWDFIRLRRGISAERSISTGFIFFLGVALRFVFGFMGMVNHNSIFLGPILSTVALLTAMAVSHFIYCRRLYCPMHVQIL